MHRHPCCFIAPPDLLAKLAEEGTKEQREAAIRTLAASASMRARRAIVGSLIREGVDRRALAFMMPPGGERVTVYDAQHQGASALPGKKVRGDGDPASSDEAVNQAYEGADTTYDFYKDVFNRSSVDDQDLELVSSVHYGVRFENAFWNGGQMVYGDGGGQLFNEGSLTSALDVIAHELTHGVTQFTAGLVYSKQSGALNESMSDVFGSLVKQKALAQKADEADWLIGAGILHPSLGQALRSMKAPGTAFKYDSQPATMADYQDLPDDNDPRHDNGGVHINSGIPNHAFYLAATEIGGFAWEAPGRIWYETLTKRLKSDAQFDDAAKATFDAAGDLFGAGSREQNAVAHAWEHVGLPVAQAVAHGG
jgi:Zn-dependent metalloprotease